jgi:hypothetical protein
MAESNDRASAVVSAHKERARRNIDSGSANAVVDRMKQVVAEKRQTAAQR